MKELSRRTGLSASAIHHYLHEGLIHPPERPTRNSAIYDDAHAERLALIRRLRRDGEGLPLVAVRRILELVDQGVEVDVAIALHRAVRSGLVGEESLAGRRFQLEELAESADVSPAIIQDLIRAGVVQPSPRAEPPFDEVDLHIVRLFRGFAGLVAAEMEEYAEIVRHLAAASEREMALRNRAVAGRSAAESAEVSRQMQESVNVWHSYMFARLREREIATHGLGTASAAADAGDRR